jgi:ribosomal protein S18 acetylase RimI-like enzyme
MGEPDTASDLALRPATAADVPAIARIWRQGWADGHQGHVPDALVAERTPASFDRRATERTGHSWVAERGGVVAGFVVVVDDEVEQLYVDRRWRGRGVAERLLGHAESATGTVPVPAHRYEREVGTG